MQWNGATRDLHACYASPSANADDGDAAGLNRA
jgi:hypothetical protein